LILPEEDIGPLRAQFFAWRSQRTGREPIPAGLWAGAVALAHTHGACPVARSLGLDDASLKAKMAGGRGKPSLLQASFLELPATRALSPASGTTIEITAPDGARMSIQLEAEQERDAASIVAAFLGSRG
jgi:hypothetical protein